ncbi:WD repeat and HMG-box DNA-binding protein 1 [Toxocara canis]|uniref:WD repeat and HMG-box DNA-binding protein 1 n=1 Tax=Toxocara canis TaxID=6265 RepID=A0A0B2VWT0_TOXCA|nr:WD repeat and HMG-box DNA-binding protein 1 [Toxocara canis]
MSAGEFSEPRLLHSPGFIDLCLNKAQETSSTAFLSSGTDGDVWLWNEDPLEDAEYEPKSALGRTHHSIAWHAFLSSGTDGDVWLWNEDPLEDAEYEPKSALGRTHHSIAWHGENVYVGHTLTDTRTGVEKAVVSRFTLTDFTSSTPIASFSLDVTSLDISSDSTVLAAGAIDHVVKVIQVGSGDYARLECEGQIMCVRIDPKGELLATSISDGTLRMYPLSVETGGSPLRMTRIASRIPDIDVTQSRLEICWTVDGSYLFAVVLGGIKRFKREAFEDPTSFISPSAVTEMFSTCCRSSCGKFVAASSMAGTICVWDVESGNVLSTSKYVRNGEAKIITSMLWHPILEATLVFADSEEHICSLSKCTKEVNSAQEKASSDRGKLIFDSDDDSKLSTDLGAIKRSYGFGEEGEHIGKRSPPPDERPFVPVKALEPIAPYEPPKVPKPFVSGSSPVHLSQRYLKWNQFGVVTSYSTNEENTIEIRWHDASVHSDMVIDNTTSRYSIADLSNEMIALASQLDIDSASELRVHCINAWDAGSREWTVQLPSGESVDNISIGNCFVAVSTTLRFIRVFSHAGTQIMLISHPGPVLTMCAAGKLLTTVALNGGYFFEDDKPQFNMSANTYEVTASGWFKRESISQSVSLALSPNAILEWIGYSKGGMLCTMDSSCCVRVLTANGVWVPIHSFASSLKSVSDHVFLISVVEHPRAELRYVYCKGTHYPLVASRLVPLVVPWTVPFCNPESEKSQLEASLFRSELLRCAFERIADNSVDIQQLRADYAKDVMRLFALACKADRECRAAELALYAHGANIIQSMCNFAAKTRHPLLVEKVCHIAQILDIMIILICV